jgi:hypothetical protein
MRIKTLQMINEITLNKKTASQALINPEYLWAIEDELINIPAQYSDNFWNELLASYIHDSPRRK